MDKSLDPETEKKHPLLSQETDNICQFVNACLDPDVMDQFPGPEIDIMSKRNYILTKIDVEVSLWLSWGCENRTVCGHQSSVYLTPSLSSI